MTSGQLGDGAAVDRSTPGTYVVGLSSGVLQVSTGSRHACALLSDQTMRCWGANDYGQLGNGTTTGQFVPNPVPVEVGTGPELFVQSLQLQEHAYPSGVLIDVPAGGATDGNQVLVTAIIANVTANSHDVQVRFVNGENDADLPNASFSVTLPPASLSPVQYTWDTTGWAWDNGSTHTGRKIKVNVTENLTAKASGTQDVKIMPKPVVLVHGFVSSAGTWSAYYGFLDHIVPGWRVFAVGDGQVPGVMNTGSMTNPLALTNTIAQNAQILNQYIEGVRHATNASHVDLVVHSMGGLISRDYIQDYMPADVNGAPVVDRLIMLGTPNRGTNCALVGPGLPFPAVLQLRNDYIDLIFNNQVTNRRNVPFSILAGDALPFTCFAPIAGDLVVSQTSALWNLADTQVKSILHLSMTSSQDVFNTFVLPRLANPAPAQATSSAAEAPHLASPLPADDTTPVQIIADGAVSVAPSATVDTTINVPAGTALSIALLAGPDVSATLIDPSNATAASVLAGDPEAGEPFRAFRIDAPAAGNWTLRLQNAGSSSALIPFDASIEGNAVSFTLDAGIPAPDGTTSLRGSLTDNGAAVTGATVTATLTGAADLGPLTLLDDGLHGDGGAGDGVYGTGTGALSPGLYSVTLHATATGISRFAKGTVNVESPVATNTPTTTATNSPTPTMTPSPTSTDTPTPAPSATPTWTASATSTPTSTPTPVPTATSTATTPAGPGVTFNVNTTTDAVDAAPGDGICASAANECTLRAAIMEANTHSGADTVMSRSATTSSA